MDKRMLAKIGIVLLVISALIIIHHFIITGGIPFEIEDILHHEFFAVMFAVVGIIIIAFARKRMMIDNRKVIFGVFILLILVFILYLLQDFTLYSYIVTDCISLCNAMGYSYTSGNQCYCSGTTFAVACDDNHMVYSPQSVLCGYGCGDGYCDLSAGENGDQCPADCGSYGGELPDVDCSEGNECPYHFTLNVKECRDGIIYQCGLVEGCGRNIWYAIESCVYGCGGDDYCNDPPETPTCTEVCEETPHIQCVGHWDISGIYPDCVCVWICDEEPEPPPVDEYFCYDVNYPQLGCSELSYDPQSIYIPCFATMDECVADIPDEPIPPQFPMIFIFLLLLLVLIVIFVAWRVRRK